MRVAALLAVAALVATGISGCGGDDPPPSPPPTLAPPQHVAGRFSLDGREQRVRSTIVPTLITEGRRNAAAVVPEGHRAVQVDFRVTDAGRDPINPDVLRFTARDSDGATLPERFRIPVRKLEPTSSRSPRVLSVAFFVPRGAKLTSLGARSILAALPLRLRWRLAG